MLGNSNSSNKLAESSAKGWIDEAEFLSEILETQTDLAAAELDPALMLQLVAERAQKLTRCDGAMVQLADSEELVIRAGTGLMREYIGLRVMIGASLAGQAVRNGTVQYAHDCETDPRVNRVVARRIGIRSIVAVPLMNGGRAIGAITIVSGRTKAFEPRHGSALRLMAGLVVASLTHASEFEIKRSLLAERSVALSSLHESERRFRRLFEHAGDAVMLNDLDGRYLDANRMACKSLGYTREALLGMSVEQVEVAFDRDQIFAQWAGMNAEQPATIHGTHRRSDGSTFPVEVRITAIEHEGRKAILAIVRDISERRNAEAALRNSEERFRSAFEHAAIGMAVVAPDGRWLQVNSAVCRIIGYSEHELLVSNFQAVTHPADLDADLGKVRELLAGDIADYQMVKRYVHKQGHVVWVLLSVSMVRDDGGAPLYFISQIQDITKRMQVEQALRESADEYQATFELEGVGKVQADLNTGRLLRVNRKFCEIMGYSNEESLCLTLGDITHGDDLPVCHETSRGMLSGEFTDFSAEKRCIRKNGEIIWTSFSATVIKDSQGRPTRVVASIADITERKRSEWLEKDRRRVLEMVAKDMPLPEVMGQLADAMDTQMTGTMACAIVLQDGNVQLHGRALPGSWREQLEQRRFTLAMQLSDGVWHSQDACGISYINTDEMWAELRPAAIAEGLSVCWSVAIQSLDGTALGLLAVFCRQSRRPTTAEVQTLDMAAKLATICIEHHHATGQLAHLVRHDSLTGLPNRIMLEDRMQHAFALARRTGKIVGIMVLDIDKFKSINDTLGHQAGDHILQQFAQRLRGCLRQTDTMARVGGDEFVIVLPECESREGVETVARKLVDSMRDPFDLSGKKVQASTSIGVAIYPTDAQEGIALQKQADAALYRVKAGGRNGFAMWDSAIDAVTANSSEQ